MRKFIKRRIINTLTYSLAGIKSCWKAEEAFRVEICVAPVLIISALFLKCYAIEKVLLISSVMLVLIIELINTGLEKIIDIIMLKDRHIIAKIVKDVGSAAVFVAIINLILTWSLIIIF